MNETLPILMLKVVKASSIVRSAILDHFKRTYKTDFIIYLYLNHKINHGAKFLSGLYKEKWGSQKIHGM